MKSIKRLVWKLLNLLNLAGLIELTLSINYLKSSGWFKSYKLKQSIDSNYKPIPWFSYPIISFLENRLNNKIDVFEFGCGNSTLWFAEKVKSIKSVEHNKDWFENVKLKLPKNAKLVYKDLVYGEKYSKEVLSGKNKYHIIIIDGRDRVNCTLNSIKALQKDGVIIFDNSQLIEYKDAIDYLIKNKFKRIDFWGQIPIAAHENCTTIFYKPNNCLNI
ncbi:MAG: FkbM family methyltransferase [Bacteroidetes bacterium]|nr:FkbM family methyltransferase [Bacteroidota bacterium]